MNIDGAIFLPEGDYKRPGVCIALVGNKEVSIHWAIRAMSVAFPPNCRRAIMCYPHPNIEVCKNTTIKEWLNAPLDMQTEWLALLEAGSPIRWDAVVNCVISKNKINKIGASYVIHRSCFGSAPWFKNNEWLGSVPTDRSDLLQDYVADNSGSMSKEESENAAKKLLTICIPTLGKTSMLWVSHAIQLGFPMVGSKTTVVAQGYEIGAARERIINTVLDIKPTSEYVLFYGDDNLPNYDAITLLFETMQKTGAAAVAGLYYMKCSPPDVPILWRNNKAGPLLPGIDFQPGEIVEVDGTGLDFVLFKTSELAKVPRPRFKTMVKWIEGKGMVVQTEDAYFWQRWLDTHGKGPLVDTRCRVGHYNHVNGVVYG